MTTLADQTQLGVVTGRAPVYEPGRSLPYIAVKDNPDGQWAQLFYLNPRTGTPRGIPFKVPAETGDLLPRLREVVATLRQDLEGSGQ